MDVRHTDDGPRVRDADVARALGLRPFQIRRMADAEHEALIEFGPLPRTTIFETSWLSEGQALYLCAFADTPATFPAGFAVMAAFKAGAKGHSTDPVRVVRIEERRLIAFRPRRESASVRPAAGAAS